MIYYYYFYYYYYYIIIIMLLFPYLPVYTTLASPEQFVRPQRL